MEATNTKKTNNKKRKAQKKAKQKAQTNSTKEGSHSEESVELDDEKKRKQKQKEIQELIEEMLKPQDPNSFGPQRSNFQSNQFDSITSQPYNFQIQDLIGKFPEHQDSRNSKNINKQSLTNPIIIEQSTTTTHSKTTCQMKVKKQSNCNSLQFSGPKFNIGLNDHDQFLRSLLGSSNQFDSSSFEDLGKPQIGELFYSDAMPENISDELSKIQWLSQVYGNSVTRSQPKTYLMKLVEYNKIEIIDNDQFLLQHIEVEEVICKLMKQRLINDEYKYFIDTYAFQSILKEQQSLIYALIKLTKKNIHTLYKKCHNFITVQSVQRDFDKRKIQYVYLKDLLHEKRAYIDMARKMGDLYEEMLKKASFFKQYVDKIFESNPVYYFLKCESIFKGFFFLFIYKDFILREVIDLMKELLPKEKQLQVLKQIEEDYEAFMEDGLVEWVNLMLTCEVFQSYSCIVTPNEIQEKRVRGQPSGQSQNQKKERSMEGQNYYNLKRKYMKNFLRAYTGSASQRNQVIHLLDSDYDEDDEDYQGEIDEIFNNSVQHSEEYDKDEIDSDDIPTEKDIKDIQQQIIQKTKSEKQLRQQANTCEKHSKVQFDSQEALFEYCNLQLIIKFKIIDKSIDCKQCKQKLLLNCQLCSTAGGTQNHHQHLRKRHIDQVKSAFQHWEQADLYSKNMLNMEEAENQNQEPAKKKKKRKRHKKKKKKPEEIAADSLVLPVDSKGDQQILDGDKAVGGASDQELQRESDADFEENLKQFELRLQQNESRQGGTTVKLKPNVSQDWLHSIQEISKSLTVSASSSFSQATSATPNTSS